LQQSCIFTSGNGVLPAKKNALPLVYPASAAKNRRCWIRIFAGSYLYLHLTRQNEIGYRGRKGMKPEVPDKNQTQKNMTWD